MTGIKFFVIVGILCVMIATLFKVYQDQNRKSLYIAVTNTDSAKVVRLLAGGVKPTFRNAFDSTALMQAATLRDAEILKTLINYGADVNAVDRHGNTALFYAVGQDNVQATTLLLKSGSDINHVNRKGLTPLFIAIEKSHIASTRTLLINKANTELKGPSGETIEVMARTKAKREVLIEVESALHNWQPLHKAAAFGDYFQVMKLVEAGADINALTKRNLTPLALAVRSEHINVVNYLFDSGAKVEFDNDKGESLLSVARKGLKAKTAVLVESRIDGWSKLMEAAALNDLSKLELYISRRQDMEFRSRFNRTALMVAVNQGNYESVQTLVEHGAKINVQDKFGWSPLMYASHLGNEKISKYLLKNNARIDYYDDFCNSAFKLSVDRIGRDRMMSSMYSVSDEKRAAIEKKFEHDPVLSMLRKAGSTTRKKGCEPKRQAKSLEEMVSTNNWLARTPISLQSSL